MDGFFIVDKEGGWTSSDVVVKIRNALKPFGKIKVGHLGTLDPAGTGVLVIALGKATRLFEFLRRERKVYEVGFVFNITTDTLDGEGKVTETRQAKFSENDVIAALKSCEGTVDQIPPAYSSISVGGKRAYDLARKGEEVELKPRPVNIFGIKLLEKRAAPENVISEKAENEYRVLIDCEGGTYVRSIARDAAAALGTVGYMSYIRRLKSGVFDISGAAKVSEIIKEPLKHLIPLPSAVESFKRFDLKGEDEIKKASNGIKSRASGFADGETVAVYADDKLFGIATAKGGFLDIKVRL
jgi:tRNA pseudouridine55 synthase